MAPEKKTPPPEPTAPTKVVAKSKYVVLRRTGTDPDHWAELGEYAGTDEQARRAAVRQHELQAVVDGGNDVVLVAVAKRSWQPRPVGVKHRDPVITV